MLRLSKSVGSELLAIARSSVMAAFSGENYRLKSEVRDRLSVEVGVFVSIYLKGELRGSFGYMPGVCPLSDGIRRAARGAAFMDSRFQPLTRQEFNNSKFEVAIIEKIEELKVKRRDGLLKRINPKRHGLLIKYGPFRAVQLPEFAVRLGLSARDYLERTVEKSGLAPEQWLSSNLRVFVFSPKVFSE